MYVCIVMCIYFGIIIIALVCKVERGKYFDIYLFPTLMGYTSSYRSDLYSGWHTHRLTDLEMRVCLYCENSLDECLNGWMGG